MHPASLVMASLVFSLLTACHDGPADPSDQRTAALGEEFELAPGQSAAVGEEGLRVTFKSVADDSRCAVDVTCVWEGDATVLVSVVRSSQSPADLELHTSRRGGAAEETYERYLVRLTRLAPQPVSTRDTDPASYRATLVVTTQ
jgi:hypothetical protein